MKYSNPIDNYFSTRSVISTNDTCKWVIARPEQGYGLLKWKRRMRGSIAVLFGLADAVTFKIQEPEAK